MQSAKTESDLKQSQVAPRLCGVAAGTRLLTPDGYQPVETLSPGDFVQVVLQGAATFEQITWMGRRDVLLTPRQQADFPVQFRPHALVDNCPARDVWLAQEHAVYIDGKLYLVRDLINDGSIAVDRRRRSATYWGVQLARHNVVLADNLAVETLLPVSASAFTVVPAVDGHAATASDPYNQSDADLGLEIEIRTALNAVTPLLLEKGVKADFAILPRLTARMKRHVLQDILTAMLSYAISSVIDGHVLLTATRTGDQAVIAVTFMGNTNREQHEANLSAPRQTASLQAARLDVAVSSEMAATVSLRVKAGLERE
ncbi:MAG TPA: Hint domain-containing protein [Rhodopila sp.]|nr:Hint domain-containing protein [Rhodopila sp.]